LLLITSVGSNIALLCFFKYTGWLSDALVSFGAISGFAVLTAGFHPPLPPGVSFYTFETISYTADVYKRAYRPSGNILDYMSFLVFSHLVAGPVRRSQLLPVPSEIRPAITAQQASRAGFLILWGLFLKIICADNLGGIVERLDGMITRSGAYVPGAGVLFSYAFADKIYCDFADVWDYRIRGVRPAAAARSTRPGCHLTSR
jgi:alginate O-acetyltransferase complex protein AlgI